MYKRIQDSGSKIQLLWLLRRPKPNKDYRGNLGWSFPKGWIDTKNQESRIKNQETPEEAALREVREEGGVEAKIVRKLPTIKIFFKNKGETVMKFITYFVMEWEKDIPEGHDWETEEVKWVTKGQALEMLAFKNEKELLAAC